MKLEDERCGRQACWGGSTKGDGRPGHRIQRPCESRPNTHPTCHVTAPQGTLLGSHFPHRSQSPQDGANHCLIRKLRTAWGRAPMRGEHRRLLPAPTPGLPGTEGLPKPQASRLTSKEQKVFSGGTQEPLAEAPSPTVGAGTQDTSTTALTATADYEFQTCPLRYYVMC